MKLIWTQTSIEEIESIVDYISLDKPQAALTWAKSVFEKEKDILKFPMSGRVVPEFGKSNIREIIVGNYRLIYKIEPEIIYIISVKNSKRAGFF